MEGSLKKLTNAKTKGFSMKFCSIFNKKFKYYNDKAMTKVGGVFDFDRIHCLVMIEDGDDE